MKRKHGGDGFEKWGGYMNAKITKLEEQFNEDAEFSKTNRLSDIFNGIAIFVNGYTSPSADQLKMLMLQHGGVYNHYETNQTTHTIASNLPNAKMKLLKANKFVKPEWITESIKAGKLLDYKQFLLYTNSALQPALQLKPKDEANTADTSQEPNKLPIELVKNNDKMEAGTSKQIPPGPYVAKTAVDPRFLTEFYNNSRLHHLSTMGAMFKQYITEIKQKHTGEFPGRERLLRWEKYTTNDITFGHKIIMHIDMDCFFVSVAIRNNPDLRGHPVAVTHAKGNPTHVRPGADPEFEYQYYHQRRDEKNGKVSTSKPTSMWVKGDSMAEIASCSYEAREAGVRNGMLLGVALKLCPNLKTAPYDFEGYKEVSMALYNTVAEYTLDIEAVSCDELFVDCTELLKTVKCKPVLFVEFLRQEIKEKTQCPSSAGLGSNKLQARLATKKAKPNGQFHLQPENVPEFMLDIHVKDLPGVGRNISEKLKSLGATTCKDLQNIKLEILKKELGGKNGENLYKQCRGEDTREVKSSHERKSVSAEVNYGIRFTNKDEAFTFFKQLSEEVSTRLKDIKKKGKCVTLKLLIKAKEAPAETAKFMGHGICDYYTKSVSHSSLFDDTATIYKYVTQIYERSDTPPSELRGIGIQITKLEDSKHTTKLDNYLKPATELIQLNRVKKTSLIKDVLKKQSNMNIQKPQAYELDADVLSSLPEEIRNEILSEYNIKMDDLIVKPSTSKEPSENILTMSQIDNSVLQALPDDLKKEIKDNVRSNSETRNSKLYKTLNVKEVRQLIGKWVANEMHPKRCDIDMIIDYLIELILHKDLDNLNIVLKCFIRHVSKVVLTVPGWKDILINILNEVQESMIKYYGAPLKVDLNF